MDFHSFHFAIYFVIVFGVVLWLRTHLKSRNIFLLIASYYFYGSWDWRFLSLIVLSTVIDWAIALWMDRLDQAEKEGKPPGRIKRKHVMVLSLLSNLGILGFFKYYDFFITSALDFFAVFGMEAHLSTLEIILPVGISFYTFQSLSYTIDVYRHKLKAEKSLVNFALFVSFFPQLVAGPIERATHLMPQITSIQKIRWEDVSVGFYLICWGVYKKIVLADNAAIVADRVFSANSPTGFDALIGIYAFAIQIYCDFSAYSDIARGSARCMGFRLMVNFNLPYFAKNPSDFWRRWHISLSSWLRDYLYFSLGGNRKGRFRTYLNLTLTMLLGGFWHGANWTFILWGAYHGFLLVMHRLLEPIFRFFSVSNTVLKRISNFWKILIFFHLVCISWLLFRAETLTQVWQMLGSIFSSSITKARSVDWDHFLIFAACAGFLFIVQLIQYLRKDYVFISSLPLPIRSIVYALLFLTFVIFGEFGGKAFIYFQF